MLWSVVNKLIVTRIEASVKMGFDLEIFGEGAPEADYIEWLTEERSVEINNHFLKLWYYYTNPIYDSVVTGFSSDRVGESGRYYRQAQEVGLPSRITGFVHSHGSDFLSFRQVSDIRRKEVVIENDIAWRINASVDFLFGKPFSFVSKSPESQKRAEIDMLLKALFEANGSIGFFQDMAVLGSVYGFVDCLVRPGEEILGDYTFQKLHSARASQDGVTSSSLAQKFETALRLVRQIDLELIEAPRALPILDENDYRKTKFYVQHFCQKRNALNKQDSFLRRLLSGFSHGAGGPSGTIADKREVVWVTEIMSADNWQRYENKELVGEGELAWGFLPVVHIQNVAQPYYYEGVSDVEPLIPLQDELNTRLSDRANRITFQSFKMYLGKGIEGFEERPISPGRMWCTDNPEASIEEFGGDAATPSEDSHIAEIREAIDKASSVTALVAGVLKSKLGNLTSAVALRLMMMGMLSKTERKKFTYGVGLKEICRMVLSILDKSGIYETSDRDREVEIVFPSPLPENMMEKLREAQIKKELGVSTEQVLRELGYETTNEK